MGIRDISIGAVALMLLAACSDSGRVNWLGRTEPNGISVGGNSPIEIYESLNAMASRLDPERRVKFEQALVTLKLVVPDHSDRTSYGDITPTFTRMVKGRDADDIIEIAAIYRASAPPDR